MTSNPPPAITTPRLQPPPGRRRSSRTLSIPSDGPPYGIKSDLTVITPPPSPKYPTHLSIKKKRKQGRFHLSPVVRHRVIIVLASPVIFVGVGLGMIVVLILLGLFVILLPFGIGWQPIQYVKTMAVEVGMGNKTMAVDGGNVSETVPLKNKPTKIEAAEEQRKGTYAEAVKANNGNKNGAVKVNDVDNGSGNGQGNGGTKTEWAKRHEDMRELNRKRSEVEMAGKGDESVKVSTLEVPAEEEFDSCDVSSGFQF